jgi:hypothetical protein
MEPGLLNHRLSECAASVNSESGDELLNGHVVLAHVALPAGEDAVVPVVGAASRYGCDVFDGGAVGVVLHARDAVEDHCVPAVATVVSKEFAEFGVGDDFGAGGTLYLGSTLVVVVGGEGDTFGAVAPIPVHVVESNFFIVAEERGSVPGELYVMVSLVPGGDFGASACFALTAATLACVLVLVELLERLSFGAGGALAGSIGEVEHFAARGTFVSSEWVSVFAVTAVVGVAVTLSQGGLITAINDAGLASFGRAEFSVVCAAEVAAVALVGATRVGANRDGVGHGIQFAEGV